MTTQSNDIAKKIHEKHTIGELAHSQDEVEHIREMVEIVLEETKHHFISKRRQPAPPPPEGGISIREAERTYGIAASTLCGWVKRGRIRVLERRLNWTYLYKEDVAKIADLYKTYGGRGRASIIRNIEKN